MKKFSFRLQSILNYRHHLEKEALDGFVKVYSEYVKIENIIEKSDQERKNLLLNSKTFIEKGDFNLLYYRDIARKGLKTRVSVNTEILNEKAKPLNVARQKLIEATKQKKILERLKDKEKQKHHLEFQTEEQHELDEFGTISYLKAKNYYV